MSAFRQDRTTLAVVGKKGASRSGERIESHKTARTGSSSGDKKQSISTTAKQQGASRERRVKSGSPSPAGSSTRNGKLHIFGRTRTAENVKPQTVTAGTLAGERDALEKSPATAKAPPRKVATRLKHQKTSTRAFDRLVPTSRLRKKAPKGQATIINNNIDNSDEMHIYHRAKTTPGPEQHCGRARIIRRIHHHEHVYWDWRDRLCHRIVWPRYHFAVWYWQGPYISFSYVYPYYLRKYVFVSLGGCWPIGYRYIRYYWYGYHPYRWYGSYPIAHEVRTETFNYYTYNYYYGTDGSVLTGPMQITNGIEPVDHTSFADVREKLAKQPPEPNEATLSDIYFDEAVKAFETGDYTTAIEKFAKAKQLAPDDTILPFAYSQALFAREQYSEAAEALRAALSKITPEKEGVFYPRGLYPDDEVLFEQIDRLAEKAKQYRFDADLQLLLGYQLLGIGEVDRALEPLEQARQDLENADAAAILLQLLVKIKSSEGSDAGEAAMQNDTTGNVQGLRKNMLLATLGILATVGYRIRC